MIRVSVRTGLIWIRTKTTDGLLRQRDGWSNGERMTNRFQIQDVKLPVGLCWTEEVIGAGGGVYAIKVKANYPTHTHTHRHMDTQTHTAHSLGCHSGLDLMLF